MDLTSDPLLERLAQTVRTRLSHVAVTRIPLGADESAVLDEIDAQALEAPVAGGGLDLGVSCGLVITTELGRRALRDPYSGAALVMDALVAGKADVTSLGTGDRRAVAAGFDAPPLTGHASGADIELSGRVTLPDSGIVDADCCVPVALDGEVLLVLVPSTSRGRSTSGVDVLDLSGTSVSRDQVVGTIGTGDPLSDPDGVLARARIRQAAYLLGLGQGAHRLAVAYAESRRQFDRHLLEYQAIAFPLAQGVIALRGTRLAVRKAAWLADNGDGEFGLAAVEALALAADAAADIVRFAMQVHGARSMSWADSAMPGYHRALRIAATRYGPVAKLWREAGVRRLRNRPPLHDVVGSRSSGEGE